VGLVESHPLSSLRLRLADRRAAMRRFNRLRGALLDDDSPAAREMSLILLLAWSGILPNRLTRAERRTAVRRLRRLVSKPLFSATLQAPLSGRHLIRNESTRWVELLTSARRISSRR
jgi:hypothetical protein